MSKPNLAEIEKMLKEGKRFSLTDEQYAKKLAYRFLKEKVIL